MDGELEELDEDKLMYDLEELIELAERNGEVVIFNQTRKEEVAKDDLHKMDDRAKRNQEDATSTQREEEAGGGQQLEQATEVVPDLTQQAVASLEAYEDGSDALLHLSCKLDVKIIQKFLIKGHTQTEVDSVHAHIEHGIKRQDVYMPSNLIAITLAARKPPLAPYRAKYLEVPFTLDYSKSMAFPSIRPGSKKDDPVVVDMHWIEYDGAKTSSEA